jgi:type II secretory pathway component PulF
MAIELRQAEAAPQQKTKAPAFAGLRLDMKISLGSRGIGVNERLLFTERVAMLLETGVSLLEALKAMQSQSEEPRLTAIMESLADTVNQGKSFSAALARHPEMFSQTYTSLVAAAEEGGFLPQVLQQLHSMDEKRMQMRASLVSALSYPAFLIVFSIAVVIFVLTVIFPKFQDLFESIRGDLPGPTLVLMFASEFLRNYWIPTLLLTGAGLWGLTAWARTPAGALRLDRLKMKTPVIRDLFVQIYLTETLGALGMSLANGVPITVALKASRDIVKNAVFGAFLDSIGKHVNEGRGIAAAFNESAWIPPMVRQMISTAEQTGNLAKVMTRVADFYTRELDKRINLFAKAIEPVMLVVMGVVVGLIVAALILPIFKLSRAVH